MKYLKKFENFDLGRFGQEQEEEENIARLNLEEDEDDWAPCNDEEVDEIPGGEWEEQEEEQEEQEEEQEENRIRRWGDEVVEKKKVNAGFQAYLDKQKAKKGDKKEEEKGGKKSKPDFLDLDKDGDKKEPMKKAAKDAKEDDKGGAKKGLTAGQKKLPEAMQKAILKKQK
jgi:hypothetical protein